MIPDFQLSLSSQSTMLRIDAEKSAELGTILTPTPQMVICGRGKKIRQHEGNVSFRRTVMAFLIDYRRATSKAQKSAVVSSVFDEVNAEGPFVKQNQQSGQWYVVSEAAAREKISQCFRDCLHDRIGAKDLASVSPKLERKTSKAKEAINMSLSPPPLYRSISAPASLPVRNSKDAFQQLLQFSQDVHNSFSSLPNGESESLCAEDVDPLSFRSFHEIDLFADLDFPDIAC